MLKNLLKYEFKATARIYGGRYLALLGVSVLFDLSLRGGENGWAIAHNDVYGGFVAVLSLVYTAVLVGTVVSTVMTIVQRFSRNLLGREGYLMHTLPVNEAQLVGSKLISSTVWSVCSILAAGVSLCLMGCILVINMELIGELPLLISKLRDAFGYHFDGSFWGAMAFAGLLCFVRMVSAIACIYAACMVGHLFKRHGTLVGILSFCWVWAPARMKLPSMLLWATGAASKILSPRWALWAVRCSRWLWPRPSVCSGSL